MSYYMIHIISYDTILYAIVYHQVFVYYHTISYDTVSFNILSYYTMQYCIKFMILYSIILF